MPVSVAVRGVACRMPSKSTEKSERISSFNAAKDTVEIVLAKAIFGFAASILPNDQEKVVKKIDLTELGEDCSNICDVFRTGTEGWNAAIDDLERSTNPDQPSPGPYRASNGCSRNVQTRNSFLRAFYEKYDKMFSVLNARGGSKFSALLQLRTLKNHRQL